MSRVFIFLFLFVVLFMGLSAYAYQPTVDRVAEAHIQEIQRPDPMETIERYDEVRGGSNWTAVFFFVLIVTIAAAFAFYRISTLEKRAEADKQQRMLLREQAKADRPQQTRPSLPQPTMRPQLPSSYPQGNQPINISKRR